MLIEVSPTKLNSQCITGLFSLLLRNATDTKGSNTIDSFSGTNIAYRTGGPNAHAHINRKVKTLSKENRILNKFAYFLEVKNLF